MSQEEYFRFVSLLGLELENGDISLPSLPDVVMKIRKMLQSDDCDFVRISRAVSIDAVLVSRLFVFANSAYYNRANIEVDSLEVAIGRLGFEVVRNTAMSLAMKQLYNANKNDKLANQQRKVWARGMKLSSMAFAVAKRDPVLNEETAYLCGLLHDVGRLYILTKAEEFPGMIGDFTSLDTVLDEWNPQVSKSIIESWGFSHEVADSADPESYTVSEIDVPANMTDVILVAKAMLDDNPEKLKEILADNLSCQKLNMNEAGAAAVLDLYRDKLQIMQQSLL